MYKVKPNAAAHAKSYKMSRPPRAFARRIDRCAETAACVRPSAFSRPSTAAGSFYHLTIRLCFIPCLNYIRFSFSFFFFS